MVTPAGEELARKGALLAVADGVSGHAGGREAAEYTVRGLLSDYYATPDTWETTLALDRVLYALNQWVIAQAQARRELSGMATTLTAIVLRGRRAVIAHVGDTRAYRFRNGNLERLTTDHIWDRPDMSHVLTRAIGLDSQLRIDYCDVELNIGDRFLLLSDGVWAALRNYDIEAACSQAPDAQRLADVLVSEALKAGTQDNVSAAVVEISAVADDLIADVLAQRIKLPVPPRLKPGASIDNFQVLELLQENSAHLLYKVTEAETGRVCVLKTLTPERGADPVERKQLAHEEWLARRAVARFFPEVIQHGAEQRSALYFVQTWHPGRTLAEALRRDRHFPVTEALDIAIRVARGICALHRRSIIHRDIKPENVHLGADGEVRILDLGVAQSGLEVGNVSSRAGTPSYLVPELIGGEDPSNSSDLYALGVTIYFALTRRYPYGEVEPFQTPHFGAPTPPTRYRPDIPVWLENIVQKLVAADVDERFETAEELLLALERGAARPLPHRPPTPLARRAGLVLWRITAIAAILLNILLAYLLVVRK